MKYLNRDVSWLSFNERVLDEAKKKTTPLAERVMFMGITNSNLDEFMQVRYPTAVESLKESELDEFKKALMSHHDKLVKGWKDFNKEHGIIRKVSNLKHKDLEWSEKYFKSNVYPAIQTITVDRNSEINPRAGTYILCVTSEDDNEYINYVELPKLLDFYIQVPKRNFCIALDDLIKYNLKYMFRDRKIVDFCTFTVLRSARVFIQQDHKLEPIDLIRKTLHEREQAWITRLEVDTTTKRMVKIVRNILPLSSNTVVLCGDAVSMSNLKTIPSSIYKEGQEFRKFVPYDTTPHSSIFQYIKKEDRLLFHPFESYQTSVVRFLGDAAVDPDVVSIKISLYRVSDDSKIVEALLRAADSGKTVTALIELKARFDERHNVAISRELSEGGVRLAYTSPKMKTHAKVCLVTRKEKNGLRIYAHVGTGNYSEGNAKIYTDYSYFTADPEVGQDLTRFFNILTSDQGTFKSRKIVYAPYNMRSTISELIDGEISKAKNGGKGRIICKCNALTDDKTADKIVSAAKAGVDITLIVRGACIIRPMKNIKIFSVVGRFLEHSRVYVFGHGKKSSMYIGSNDLMHRNLTLRNELMIKVSGKNKARIMGHLDMYMKDNTNRRVIKDNYKYELVDCGKKESSYTCQDAFIKEAKKLTIG